VVAIIGILAAVALPAYQDYTIRAKMSEVILVMSACRTSVTEVYQSGGSAPGAGGWGCEISASQATKYVAGVTTTIDGMINATVQGIADVVDTSVVSLLPLANATTAAVFTTGNSQSLFGWQCGGSSAATPAGATTVNRKYLPGSCRG
jgi:type IV pilus assembly protein PilA